MKDEKFCGTCKHLGDSLTHAGEPSTYFQCDRVWHNFEYDLTKGKGAFVLDAEQYHAVLCVEADFGCRLWEAKE